MTGKIIKGIAGFYYVFSKAGVYTCKAKGIFRKDKKKPLVGDDVVFDILDESDKEGNITEILPRKNELIRPALSNVDQALVIFALASPKPNLNLLDRFLVAMERQGIGSLICFNKGDLVSSEEEKELRDIYHKTGYKLLFTSAEAGVGISELKKALKGKTTAVAGPSGVGKSSLINLLQSGVEMETGEISEKIGRGKHTTRHSQLIPISPKEDTFIVDTPGFSSLNVEDLEKEDLKEYFPEFTPYVGMCRFLGCNHVHEPDCAVKDALKKGEISESRYENYLLIYEDLTSIRSLRRY